MRPLITLTTPLVWGLAAGSILTLAAVLADRLKINWSLRPGESFAIMCALGLTVGLIGELRGPYRLAIRILFASTLALALVASPYETPDSDPYYMQLLEGLISALLFGLVGEVALRIIGGELPLMEHLSWSWEQARPSVIRFVTGGTVFAVALDVPNWLTMGSMLRLSALATLITGLLFGAVLGVFFSLSLGLARGLRVTPVPTRPNPYQGVKSSFRYGMLVGVGAGLVTGSLFFITSLVVSPQLAITRALVWGPGAVVVWGLPAGLGGVLQYGMLRLLLWRYDLAPLRYEHWLNHVVSLRLMYRGMGGGYVFIHPIVQEHLADTAMASARLTGQKLADLGRVSEPRFSQVKIAAGTRPPR